jgi:hypothetical protein
VRAQHPDSRQSAGGARAASSQQVVRAQQTVSRGRARSKQSAGGARAAGSEQGARAQQTVSRGRARSGQLGLLEVSNLLADFWQQEKCRKHRYMDDQN